MYFYKIEGNPYLADIHHFHKAMAPIGYPATKAEIIAKIGDKKIKVGHDEYKTVEEMVAPLALEEYSCGCAFYCALIANIYKD
ncbi:MAG: hypothetical protein LBS91_09780 [Clostridiales Family XIII bacterium]|jgi:hypothetical protein|nr:hypothetical protein [Clostridiales Family XIII bacterium]